MNARSEATLTLETVAKHFAHWRRNKNNGERYPKRFGTKRSPYWEPMGSHRSAEPCAAAIRSLLSAGR